MTRAKPKAVPLTMTIREACAVLGKGETWMRERIADGTLSASRVGRSVLLSRSEVMALVPGRAREVEAAE